MPPIVLTAVTVKSLLTWTSTSLPSDFLMWASYGALSSTLVSTRSTVPDTFFSAASRTLAAVAPVSGSSVRPLSVWRAFGPPCCAAGGEPDGVAVGGDDELDVAALAIAPPPRAAAPIAAAVTSLERMVLPMSTPLWGLGRLDGVPPL